MVMRNTEYCSITRKALDLIFIRWALLLLFSTVMMMDPGMGMEKGPPTGNAHRLRQYAILTPEARIMGKVNGVSFSVGIT